MEKSILKSTKKILGIMDGDGSFDLDIITFTNTALSSLRKLGIGPPAGVHIEDDTIKWDDAFPLEEQIHDIKTYVHLRVTTLFDPPGTSYHLEAVKQQIAELTHTMLTERNLKTWTAPSSSPSLP